MEVMNPTTASIPALGYKTAPADSIQAVMNLIQRTKPIVLGATPLKHCTESAAADAKKEPASPSKKTSVSSKKSDSPPKKKAEPKKKTAESPSKKKSASPKKKQASPPKKQEPAQPTVHGRLAQKFNTIDFPVLLQAAPVGCKRVWVPIPDACISGDLLVRDIVDKARDIFGVHDVDVFLSRIGTKEEYEIADGRLECPILFPTLRKRDAKPKKLMVARIGSWTAIVELQQWIHASFRHAQTCKDRWLCLARFATCENLLPFCERFDEELLSEVHEKLEALSPSRDSYRRFVKRFDEQMQTLAPGKSLIDTTEWEVSVNIPEPCDEDTSNKYADFIATCEPPPEMQDSEPDRRMFFAKLSSFMQYRMEDADDCAQSPLSESIAESPVREIEPDSPQPESEPDSPQPESESADVQQEEHEPVANETMDVQEKEEEEQPQPELECEAEQAPEIEHQDQPQVTIDLPDVTLTQSTASESLVADEQAPNIPLFQDALPTPLMEVVPAATQIAPVELVPMDTEAALESLLCSTSLETEDDLDDGAHAHPSSPLGKRTASQMDEQDYEEQQQQQQSPEAHASPLLTPVSPQNIYMRIPEEVIAAPPSPFQFVYHGTQSEVVMQAVLCPREITEALMAFNFELVTTGNVVFCYPPPQLFTYKTQNAQRLYTDYCAFCLYVRTQEGHEETHFVWFVDGALVWSDNVLAFAFQPHMFQYLCSSLTTSDFLGSGIPLGPNSILPPTPTQPAAAAATTTSRRKRPKADPDVQRSRLGVQSSVSQLNKRAAVLPNFQQNNKMGNAIKQLALLVHPKARTAFSYMTQLNDNVSNHKALEQDPQMDVLLNNLNAASKAVFEYSRDVARDLAQNTFQLV